MPRIERDDPTIARLYKIKPHKLAVYVRGEDRAKMVPLTGGNRWRKLKEVLDAIAWESIEALGAKDELLDVIRADSSEQLVDELDDVDRAARIAQMMFETHKLATQNARDLFKDQLQETSNLIRACSQAMAVMQESYGLALKVQAAAYAMGAANAAPAEDDSETGLDKQVTDLVKVAVLSKLGIPPQMMAMMNQQSKAPSSSSAPPRAPAPAPTKPPSSPPAPAPKNGAH